MGVYRLNQARARDHGNRHPGRLCWVNIGDGCRTSSNPDFQPTTVAERREWLSLIFQNAPRSDRAVLQANRYLDLGRVGHLTRLPPYVLESGQDLHPALAHLEIDQAIPTVQMVEAFGDPLCSGVRADEVASRFPDA